METLDLLVFGEHVLHKYGLIKSSMQKNLLAVFTLPVKRVIFVVLFAFIRGGWVLFRCREPATLVLCASRQPSVCRRLLRHPNER